MSVKKVHDRPKLRFEGYSDVWTQQKMKDIAMMHARIGWQNLRTSEFLEQGDYYLVTGTDFDNGSVDFEHCHYVGKDRFEQDVNIQLVVGSILITKDGTLGKIAYIRELNKPATLNAGIFNVLVRENSDVDGIYLFQYLRAPFLMNFVAAGATGGTIKHLNQNLLINFPVNHPSLEEQKKIGKAFSDLDSLITLQQRKLSKLQDIKKALLAKMFPAEGENVPAVRFKGFTDAWEQRRLGEYGSVSMNKRIFKNQTAESGDIPFYKIGTFGGVPDAYISRDLYEEYKKKYSYPKKGDVLISASGSIGRTVVYDGEEAYYQDSNIVWLNHDSRLDDSFLLYVYAIVKWSGIEGSTISRLYNENILSTRVIIPIIEEQRKIGGILSRVDTLITLHQRKLSKLKDIKKALLNEMFPGGDN